MTSLSYPSTHENQDIIQQSLETIRKHFSMEVAYFSEFVDGRSVFRRIDAPGFEDVLKEGDSNALEDVYCGHIIEGRLPKLIPNTAKEPLARSMPITDAVPIGSHMSIPIHLSDGSIYGNFCCLSREANESLNDRDLQTMQIFADLVARQVDHDVKLQRESAEKRSRILNAVSDRLYSVVYQPIFTLSPLEIAGFEALTRFEAEPRRTPDVWFNEAADVGMGVDLELAAISAAVERLPDMPAGTYLSFNASPETVASGRLSDVLPPSSLDRLKLEVTEHALVSDYPALTSALEPLRRAGLRLAVDDAGAGYSTLQHILQLKPDTIKLDMSLTRDVDTDPARRALASALIFFARETGMRVVAEGIETEGEMEMLKMLGVNMGQGYYLARPAALEDALAGSVSERRAG